MAVTINIYYTGTNGSARRFAEEMTASGVVAAIRSEEGNLRYEYFFPMEDPETLLLIDSWRDQEALDGHHVSTMMARIAKLRDKMEAAGAGKVYAALQEQAEAFLAAN